MTIKEAGEIITSLRESLGPVIDLGNGVTAVLVQDRKDARAWLDSPHGAEAQKGTE